MISKTFCVLPWIHLASHPNGGVSLCCRSNHTDAISWAKSAGSKDLLTLEKNSLEEIVNSETFTRVRSDMLEGIRPLECEGCWKDENLGLESKRQYENKRWSKVIPLLDKSSIIKSIDYRYIELRLGNLCNNACITCNSYSSSKWYKDEEFIAKKLDWFELRPLENFKWFQDTEFYDNLFEVSNNVEEIYINGGEPTLITAHFNFLNRLIDQNKSSNVTLVYSLNLMSIPDKLIELWTKFKKVIVNCSIDDLEDRNYYIRWPTKWTDVISSLEKLNSLGNVEWHVTQTVSLLNIDNLDEVYNWLKTRYNKVPHHNYVLYPNYLSLSAIPDDFKEQLRYYYKGKLDVNKHSELMQKLEIEHDQTLTKKAYDFLCTLDQSRKLNYKDYLPHLDLVFENL